MLVLRRRSGESVSFSVNGVEFEVNFRISYGECVLAIEAPKCVQIVRSELKRNNESGSGLSQGAASDPSATI